MMNPYDGDLSCEQIQAVEIKVEGGEAKRCAETLFFNYLRQHA